jgi:dTDP-4-dehydrorhamnose reductase
MFLIIGADSEIGAAAFQRLAGSGETVAGTTRRAESVGADRHMLDLARPLGAWAIPPAIRAACMCAAIARVADCAADPIGSAHVNVEQTVALIERLVAREIYVLFLSTNQVFDGNEPDVAPETMPTPVSDYGRQKARTEAALVQLMDRGAAIGILRLAKVVSPGIALLCGWAKTLAAGRPIRPFADMMMAPTPIDLAASAIDRLMRERASGIYQLSGPRDVSYDQIGRYIAGRVGAPLELVEAVPAASAGMPAGSTPRHTTLDSARLRDCFGLRVPEPWQVIESVIPALAGHLKRPLSTHTDETI